MSNKIWITNSPLQTKKLAYFLAKKTLERPLTKKAFILALEGELGGGKTTFLQGFGKGLRIREKILSPSFIIMRKFPISNSQFLNFYHIDCYRIQKPKEILALGFKEIISNPKNIVAIEWAGRIKKIIPKKTLWIKFKFINENKRKIFIKND